MKLTDRQRVELMILPQLMLGVLNAGVTDPDDPDARECAKLLLEATKEPVADLVEPSRSAIIRRMFRLHKMITGPYEVSEARADKVGLMTYYLMRAVTDSGYLILFEGSNLDKAMRLMLPALEPSAAIERLDTSAQKAARWQLARIQEEGYFPGVQGLR